MDSVRSEYSEGSVTSSRLDDGSGTGRASLSFSFSNSHTSRLSIDSASTRSDYLSNYERKFQERKAAKHKRSEKAKREKEKADRQELFSADLRRKAAREAERLARRKEMETWLVDPNELRRIERRSQKRSRDRMRTLKEWYTPALSGPVEEVQPVFVAALSQEQSNQEHPTRKKGVKPLLSKEAAALKDEEDREVLEAALQRQLTDFTTKLEYLEHFTGPTTSVAVRAKTRAGPRRRRRIAREDMLLAPLGPARSNLQAAKSVVNLPSRLNEIKIRTSTSLQTLRPMSRFHADNEDAEDEMDDAEVEQYLSRHRKAAKQLYAAVKLQSTWKMYIRRRKYLPWRQRRSRQRRAVFEIWVMTYRVGNRAQRSLMRKYFTAWHTDVVESLQLREMELLLFRQAATQAELPRMVLNLVFTSDWEDERAKRMAAKAAEAAKKKDIAPTSKAAFLGAFLSSAFGDMESVSGKARSRVHQLRAQHIAAREEVRKKVVQHVFRLWKRVHEANKRVGLNAQLCLKRAVRMAFGTRQRWPAEILLSVFDIWARWASFNRCRRLGLPLPHFAQANSQWDIWLHNYQERQVRCVKAAAKAPGARLRRFFLRLHAFARRASRERHVLAVASDHHLKTLRCKVLLEWREAIADSAAEKKLVRGVLLRFHRYANAKRKLRPLKESLRQRHREWLSHRAWRGWKRVELHACFKRELNLSRLENSQAWRSRLHHTLDIWRDERNSLILRRTLEAWTHFIRKRKLFLTLQLLCTRVQRRNLLQSVFDAWKAAKWDRVDGFLEDGLRLDAWDAYRELSVFFPMMFYGSFSDAGSIFGGLPGHMYGDSDLLQRLNQSKEELLLSTSGDAIRHFHCVLVRDSVVEVRNAILQTRHLVNAVDDATGNTALHVAAQIEEPERRLEIVSLLLSEGATTLKRVNRHGLSPMQLSPDADTRFLLDKGVFDFYSRNSLNQEFRTKCTDNDPRLLWCMVTLMSREWGAGLRVPADVKIGQWHSTLREELWLRQKCIRFSPESTFVPAVLRSRGFLNALKTRVCVSRHDVLHGALPQKRLKVKEDPTEARERRYLKWEQRSQIRRARASETGSYEAYARYLLATTLDTEACEQELIPSFVGLIFCLEFDVEDVLIHARQLEKDCTTAEGELWELFQRMQRAERTWSALFTQEDKMSDSTAKFDVGLLRLFSDDVDAEFFFRREIFLLEFEEFKSRERHESEDGMDIHQEALLLEIEPLLTRTKRKLRKAEKKIKRVQDQIDECERIYREALFATSRRVEHISTTRMALEHAHLRMALTLLKQNEVRDYVSRLNYAKQVLHYKSSPSDAQLSAKSPASDELPPAVAAMTIEERKEFLKREKTRYSTIFETKVVLEEARTAAKNPNDNTQEMGTKELPEALHPLQKEAVSKVHSLFVLNLFRSCCCWLADNIIATQQANAEESDSGSEGSDSEPTFIDETSSRSERNSVKMTRILNAAGALFSDGMSRRRSSLRNTRRVLETYHRGCSLVDMLDPDGEAMNATYAASAALLFEEERRAVQEAEREGLNAKKVETVSIISERNPITGELEVPPVHIVDINSIPASVPTESTSVLQPKELTRNRKKEELQRAMLHQRLQRNRDSDSDDSVDSTQSDLLPLILGTGLHFGTFVAGDGSWSEEEQMHEKVFPNRVNTIHKKQQDAATTEAMWKRGGVRLADGSAPSIKEVLTQAHRLSTSREKLRTGSRRQGVNLQAPSEFPLQLQEVQEAQPALASHRKNSASPPQLGNSSPINEQEKSRRRNSIMGNRRLLARAASLSCLPPATKTNLKLSGTAGKSEAKLPLQTTEVSSHVRDRDVNNPGSVQESEELAIPAIQISMRSRPSSAIAEPTERTSCRDPSGVAASPSSPKGLDQEFELREEEPVEMKTRGDERCEQSMGVKEATTTLAVELPETTTQSPVVQISTSESPTLGVLDGIAHPQQSDSLPNSFNAFIKWDEAAVLEAFPLQVVPSTRPKSADGRQLSSNREKVSTVPQVGSLRLTKVNGGLEELQISRFVLDESVDEWLELSSEKASEVFTLHGKSLAMAKKQKRGLCKSSTTGTLETIEKKKQTPVEMHNIMQISAADDVDSHSPDALLPTPLISVKVVTKPVKREVEIDEPPEILIDMPLEELPCAKIPKVPSSKPFVKFEVEANVETDTKTSPPLQLDGLGLGISASDVNKVDSTKRDQGTTQTSRVPVRQSRTRALKEPLPSSPRDFTLQGARMAVPSVVKPSKEPKELTGFEGMAPLSKTEKERLWQEFVATPLSSSVQDAYTILYPRTYPIPVTSKIQSAQVPPVTKKTQPPPLTTDLTHLSLRVGSTRQPVQKALDLDKKFWSAVEGYRAIGSFALIPLDAATIAQRRQDKAKAIYDQFVCGQRATSGTGDYRDLALAWLEMYPHEVADVRQKLSAAPKELFDELQRTAELQISSALSKQHTDETLG